MINSPDKPVDGVTGSAAQPHWPIAGCDRQRSHQKIGDTEMSAEKAPVRLPLTDEDLERLTGDDFGKVKLTEDEKSRLRATNERRRQEVQRKAVEWARAEAPLVQELRAAGAQVLSVWDLVNTKDRYPQLIP